MPRVRSSGRRSHRGGCFRPPEVLSRLSYIDKNGFASRSTVSYGIILKHQGGTKCDVLLALDNNDLMKLSNARLKTSLAHRRCKQRLVPGLFCLVDDGSVVLVYKPTENDYVDQRVRDVLKRESGLDLAMSSTKQELEIEFGDAEKISRVQAQEGESPYIYDEEEEDNLDCI